MFTYVVKFQQLWLSISISKRRRQLKSVLSSHLNLDHRKVNWQRRRKIPYLTERSNIFEPYEVGNVKQKEKGYGASSLSARGSLPPTILVFPVPFLNTGPLPQIWMAKTCAPDNPLPPSATTERLRMLLEQRRPMQDIHPLHSWVFLVYAHFSGSG